ncbi:MAG TPA: hypothetical protein VGE62_00375 [Candidatus Paceibacterota bacterium]
MKKPLAGALISIIVIAIAVAGAYVYMKNKGSDSANVPAPNITAGEEVGIQGEFACLPRKTDLAPRTEACLIGLKSDAGSFYALDTSAISEDSMKFLMSLPEETKVRVFGKFVPVEQLDSETAQHDIEGLLEVKGVSNV